LIDIIGFGLCCCCSMILLAVLPAPRRGEHSRELHLVAGPPCGGETVERGQAQQVPRDHLEGTVVARKEIAERGRDSERTR
jgi:hypothetical protein